MGTIQIFAVRAACFSGRGDGGSSIRANKLALQELQYKGTIGDDHENETASCFPRSTPANHKS